MANTATIDVIWTNDTDIDRLFDYLSNSSPDLSMSSTATTFYAADSDDHIQVWFTGTGFSYDGSGNVTAGSVDTIEIRDASGTQEFTFTFSTGMNAAALWTAALASNTTDLHTLFDAYSFTLNGNIGADTFTGFNGGNTLNGSDGDDTLTGGTGADTINGGVGNDTIEGGAGIDHLDGGTGTNTLSYSHDTTGVNVQLKIGVGAGGDAEGDTFTNFQNITGGSGVFDYLQGDNNVNVISGGDGTDLIQGFGGADILDGGSGIDNVEYNNSAAAVTVTLGDNGAQTIGHGGDAEGDKISNFEVIEGSSYADILTGNNLDNTFYGNGGNDILIGGAGNDFFIGASGADTIDGGAGTYDEAYYIGSLAGITVTLGNNGAQTVGHGGDAEGDKLSNIEFVMGSEFDDVLTGNNLVNIFNGYDGNDLIQGGAGADSMTGDGGIDTVSYANSAKGVSVFLSGSSSAHEQGGDAEGDILSDFENIIGSAKDDILTGDGGDNVIMGGAGNDLIEGGAGGDTLDGGAGVNTLSYATSAGSVQITLADGTAQGFANGGDATGDHIFNFQNIIGSNDMGGDVLIGNSAANDIRGGDGTDNLHGGGGNDRLDGGDGDDSIYGDAGSDTIIGGDGVDAVNYSASAIAVTIKLGNNGAVGTATGGDAAGDKISGIETVFGSTHNDVLTGSNGIDSLLGGDGDDLIEGGAGLDSLYGGNDIDTVSYAHSSAAVTVAIDPTNFTFGTGGDAQGDGLVGFENILGSDFDDVLTGDSDVNTIDGGKGNDTIEGGAGADTLKGGAGIDTLSYAGSSVAVNVTLDGLNPASVTSTGGDADSDIATGFENLTGSAHDDHLTGDSGANFIMGGAGNDTIDGGAGNDIIDGGAGNDVLTGGAGVNTVTYAGASAGVTVTLGFTAQQDTVGAGRDTLSGFTHIIGSIYDDTLASIAAGLTIDGSDGDDTLIGGRGDTFIGGSGNDTIVYSGQGDITVDLTAQKVSGALANGDKISGIENATGSDDGNDVIIGNSQVNVLDGMDFLGGFGNTISYAPSKVGVTVDLTASTASGGDAQGDTIANFQSIIGTAAADILTGDSGINRIDGGAGDDVIAGKAGNDTLVGGVGNDTISFAGGSAVVVDLTIQDGHTAQATGQGSLILSGFENAIGSSNADTITGDKNNNVIEGGAGDDTLNGGLGTNTASYEHASGGVNIDLMLTTQQDTQHAGMDTLSGFQNLRGSSSGDNLYGTAGVNVIQGGGGDDLIDGRGGADVIDGGDATDTVSYSSSTVGVKLTLGKDGAQSTGSGGDAQGDKISNVESIRGSDHNDVLAGNNLFNDIAGGQGDDIITGGATDFLNGGAGIDTVTFAASTAGVSIGIGQANQTTSGVGGDANNTTIENFEILIGSSHDDEIDLYFGSIAQKVDLGAGNDTLINDNEDNVLIGGAGIDTISYTGESHNVTLNLAVTTTQATGVGNDTISGFENIIGSDFADTLTGDKNANVIEGGLGDDVLDGGAGIDTLSFANATGNTTFNLSLTGTQNTGSSGSDTVTGFENLIGARDHHNTLTGNAAANIITGGVGDDVIEGGAGADTLSGGLGYGFGDTVSYAHSVAGVTLTLGANGAQTLGKGGDAAGDKISNFQSITGSDQNDVLTGNELVNTIDGGMGDDTIEGGSSPDTLKGGGGIDTVSYAGSKFGVYVDLDNQDGTTTQANQVGDAASDKLSGFENILGSKFDDIILSGLGGNGAANNKIDGGAGNDTVSYENASVFVSVDLSKTVAQNTVGGGIDTLLNIENVTGSQWADALIGNAGNNTINGGQSDDIITGGAGNDTMDGGSGNEISGDTLSYTTATAAITVTLDYAGPQNTGGAGVDTVLDFENLTGGKGNDILSGDSHVNIIIGGLGDDTIEGGAGADHLFGGAGGGLGGQNDTVSYVHSQGAVTVDLTLAGHGVVGPSGMQSGGDAQGDVLSDFANVTGGDFSDILTGDSFANKLDGGFGSDTLSGGGGNDNLIGGAGDDIIAGGTGADTMDGGTGNDTLDYSGSTANVTIALGDNGAVTTGSGAAGSDAIGDKVKNFENITGSAANDTLTGNKLDNIIEGGGGSDKLTGGAGNDHFVYNAAADGGDNIVDFNNTTQSDKFDISKAGFGGNLSSLGSTLSDPTYFVAGTAADQAGHGQFIFDISGSTTNALYWDDDGTGGNAEILIATVSKSVILNDTNFLLH